MTRKFWDIMAPNENLQEAIKKTSDVVQQGGCGIKQNWIPIHFCALLYNLEQMARLY